MHTKLAALRHNKIDKDNWRHGWHLGQGSSRLSGAAGSKPHPQTQTHKTHNTHNSYNSIDKDKDRHEEKKHCKEQEYEKCIGYIYRIYTITKEKITGIQKRAQNAEESWWNARAFLDEWLQFQTHLWSMETALPVTLMKKLSTMLNIIQEKVSQPYFYFMTTAYPLIPT